MISRCQCCLWGNFLVRCRYWQGATEPKCFCIVLIYTYIFVGSPSSIGYVSRMNTDVLGLYWLQVRPFFFYHHVSSCMNFNRWLTWTAWRLPLVAYDIKDLLRTPFFVVFVLHELLFSIICFSFGLCAGCPTVCGFWLLTFIILI